MQHLVPRIESAAWIIDLERAVSWVLATDKGPKKDLSANLLPQDISCDFIQGPN